MSKRKDGETPEEIAKTGGGVQKRKEQRMQQSSQMVADEEGSERKSAGKSGMKERVPLPILCRMSKTAVTAGMLPETVRRWTKQTASLPSRMRDIQKLLDFIAQLQAKIDFDEASEENKKTTENNADEDGAEQPSQEEKKEPPVDMDSVKLDAVESYISQKKSS